MSDRTDALAVITATAIRNLFGLTLEMSSVLEINRDPEVARRIRQLINHTDHLIHEFRLAESEATASQGGLVAEPVQSSTQPRMGERSRQGIPAVSLLREASLAIDRSLAFAHHSQTSNAMLEVDLEEASMAVHRALIALTA
jgi:hypothetical protein